MHACLYVCISCFGSCKMSMQRPNTHHKNVYISVWVGGLVTGSLRSSMTNMFLYIYIMLVIMVKK